MRCEIFWKTVYKKETERGLELFRYLVCNADTALGTVSKKIVTKL